MSKVKVLVVGQTPPPFGGQSLMIKYMLDGFYSGLEFYHVRMSFSREFDDRGKFSLYKIFHLFCVILNIWKIWLLHKPSVLYYPPSSAPKVAVLRDVVILALTRFLFSKLVYHFHASGISEELPNYNRLLRKAILWILRKPDASISSSVYNPDDSSYVQSKRTEIIPLGIPDENEAKLRNNYCEKSYLTVLFVGLLNSTKGEKFVLDAIATLNKRGYDVRFKIAGRFETEEYRDYFFSAVDNYGLRDKVEYLGVVTGKEKQRAFLESDIFCFPSFFSSESFGIVLLEAMMYQMPLIASEWRGIKSIVDHGNNGYLVPIKDSDAIAQYIEKFYKDRTLIKKMSIRSREMFEDKYILSRYLERIEGLLMTL